MRIAYVCADPGVPVFGLKGASRHVREVLRALVRWGAQVELFATRLGGTATSGLDQGPVHRLPSISAGDPACREAAALAANGGLRAALERAGPFDLVYERYSLWSFAGMAYGQTRGIPGLLEVNAPLIEEQATYRCLVDRPAAEQVAARAFGAATALLAVSEGVAAYLKSRPVDPQRVHIVPNGVDPRLFRPGLPAAWPGDPLTFTVVFVGTLKAWHGLDTLVEAFDRLHSEHTLSRLLIVGDGPMRDRVETSLAARNLLDSAYLAGPVPPDDVPHWLASAQVAVAPYPDLEPFYFSPLKVFEYMAAGLPVVTSNVGQLRSLIRDGVTGIRCPPGDAAALSTALARLGADPDLRARLGQAARKAILQHHTWEAVVARILDLASAGHKAGC